MTEVQKIHLDLYAVDKSEEKSPGSKETVDTHRKAKHPISVVSY